MKTLDLLFWRVVSRDIRGEILRRLWPHDIAKCAVALGVLYEVPMGVFPSACACADWPLMHAMLVRDCDIPAACMREAAYWGQYTVCKWLHENFAEWGILEVGLQARGETMTVVEFIAWLKLIGSAINSHGFPAHDIDLQRTLPGHGLQKYITAMQPADLIRELEYRNLQHCEVDESVARYVMRERPEVWGKHVIRFHLRLTMDNIDFVRGFSPYDYVLAIDSEADALTELAATTEISDGRHVEDLISHDGKIPDSSLKWWIAKEPIHITYIPVDVTWVQIDKMIEWGVILFQSARVRSVADVVEIRRRIPLWPYDGAGLLYEKCIDRAWTRGLTLDEVIQFDLGYPDLFVPKRIDYTHVWCVDVMRYLMARGIKVCPQNVSCAKEFDGNYEYISRVSTREPSSRWLKSREKIPDDV